MMKKSMSHYKFIIFNEEIFSTSSFSSFSIIYCEDSDVDEEEENE